MATRLVKPDRVDAAFLYPFLLARTEELEGLYSDLQVSFDASSKDSADLRQANAVKDEVLSLVAHELRGPLTTILGNASILLDKRGLLPASAVDLALQDIQQDAWRLQRLIANLLVLARPELENPMPEEALDFYRLVRTTVEGHRKAWPQRQIHLVAEEVDILVPAHHDYTEEVFTNLLSNAEKYSPPDEPIEVRICREGDCIVSSVLDRGPGIAQTEVDFIFVPYYRSPSTSTSASGVGLGLAACKRLVEIQGGRLWFTPREGGGSEFVFTLPTSRGEPSSSRVLGLDGDRFPDQEAG